MPALYVCMEVLTDYVCMFVYVRVYKHACMLVPNRKVSCMWHVITLWHVIVMHKDKIYIHEKKFYAQHFHAGN